MILFRNSTDVRRLIVLLLFCLGMPSLSVPEEPTRKVDAGNFSGISSTVLSPVYGPLAEQLVSEFNLAEKEGTGIDIGGGPGNLVIELCKRTRYMHWINTDIDTDFFPFTARAVGDAGMGNRVSTMFADAQDLPFQDNFADIIVSRGSFQFWKDRRKAFSEIYRVLKPGGTVYIGRGFSDNLPVEVARKIRDSQKERGDIPGYDVAQTASELETIVTSLGIVDYRIRIPRPQGSEGVNYGIWLEFHKPVSGKSALNDHPEYVLEPIEVRSSALRDVKQNPMSESSGLETSTTVIERQEIQKQGAKTVVDALELVPGAWVETRGRKVKQFFSTRGQTYPYPEYAVDGALFREFHETPYFFSSTDIERIEVMRSSAAMLTGISGLAGVINIIPRTYTKPETSWEVEYGTFDTYRSHISHGGKVGDVSYSLGMDSPHTDGPTGRKGAENMTDFQGHVGWKLSPSLSIQTNLYHINGKRELVQALPPAALQYREDIGWFDPFRTTFASVKTLYQPSSKYSTELLICFADRDHMYNSEADSVHASAREWDHEWGLNLVQSLSLSKDNVLRVGGYYNHWVAPNGKRFYMGRKCDLETFSGVVVDEHRFGLLTLDAGLRWSKTYIHDYGSFNIKEAPKGLTNVEPVHDEWEPSLYNGSIGASYYLSSYISLHANFATGYVRPRSGTLDVNGKEPGNEQRLKLDAGIRLTNKRFGEASIVGFTTRQKDAIVLSGTTTTVNGRIMELYLNRDQNQTGIELETKSAPLYHVAKLFFNFTAMRSTAESDGKMIRNSELPRYIGGGGIYSTLSHYDCNIFWKYISSYKSTRFAETPKGKSPVPEPLGDFHTFNVNAGRSFGSTLRTRIYLEIINLTDKNFSTVVGYPDYGRRYTIGLSQVF